MRDTKEIAEQLVACYGTRNPYELAKFLNIHIQEGPLGKIHGCTLKLCGEQFLYINSSLAPCRRKLLTAHALAMYLPRLQNAVPCGRVAVRRFRNPGIYMLPRRPLAYPAGLQKCSNRQPRGLTQKSLYIQNGFAYKTAFRAKEPQTISLLICLRLFFYC